MHGAVACVPSKIVRINVGASHFLTSGFHLKLLLVPNGPFGLPQKDQNGSLCSLGPGQFVTHVLVSEGPGGRIHEFVSGAALGQGSDPGWILLPRP